MKERSRKHDDAHQPLRGHGKRANRKAGARPAAVLVVYNPTSREELEALAQRIDEARNQDCFDEPFLPEMSRAERDYIIAALRAAKPERERVIDVEGFMTAVRSRWNFEENEFDSIEKVISDPECIRALKGTPA